jgi:hypothetical protein
VSSGPKMTADLPRRKSDGTERNAAARSGGACTQLTPRRLAARTRRGCCARAACLTIRMEGGTRASCAPYHCIMLSTDGAPLIPAGGSVCRRLKSRISRRFAGVVMLRLPLARRPVARGGGLAPNVHSGPAAQRPLRLDGLRRRGVRCSRHRSAARLAHLHSCCCRTTCSHVFSPLVCFSGFFFLASVLGGLTSAGRKGRRMKHGASAAVPHTAATASLGLDSGRGVVTPKKRRAPHQAALQLLEHHTPGSR